MIRAIPTKVKPGWFKKPANKQSIQMLAPDGVWENLDMAIAHKYVNENNHYIYLRRWDEKEGEYTNLNSSFLNDGLKGKEKSELNNFLVIMPPEKHMGKLNQYREHGYRTSLQKAIDANEQNIKVERKKEVEEGDYRMFADGGWQPFCISKATELVHSGNILAMQIYKNGYWSEVETSTLCKNLKEMYAPTSALPITRHGVCI